MRCCGWRARSRGTDRDLEARNFTRRTDFQSGGALRVAADRASVPAERVLKRRIGVEFRRKARASERRLPRSFSSRARFSGSTFELPHELLLLAEEYALSRNGIELSRCEISCGGTDFRSSGTRFGPERGARDPGKRVFNERHVLSSCDTRPRTSVSCVEVSRRVIHSTTLAQESPNDPSRPRAPTATPNSTVRPSPPLSLTSACPRSILALSF